MKNFAIIINFKEKQRIRINAKPRTRNSSRFKTKKSDLSSLFSVVPPGIEPGTQGFSVLCSTN